MKKIYLLLCTVIISVSTYAQILTSEVKVEHTGNITSIQGEVGIGTMTPFQKLSIQDGQLYFGHSTTNQFESGRLRFSEFATGHFQGAFIHYDGSTNVFNIGVHNAGGINISDDKNAISIARSTGNVGIGTTSPFQKLSIQNGQLYFGHSSTNQFESGRLRFSEYSSGHFQGAFIHYDGSTNVFNIGVHNAGGTNISDDKNAISIARSTGNVGIGMVPSTHKLDVAGSIHASGDVTWPDFVFKDEYFLPSLNSVKDHIEKNGHLPNIPNASEVKNEGINLVEMDAKLLQKIEELTLYLIEQNKEITEMKKEISALKNK